MYIQLLSCYFLTKVGQVSQTVTGRLNHILCMVGYRSAIEKQKLQQTGITVGAVVGCQMLLTHREIPNWFCFWFGGGFVPDPVFRLPDKCLYLLDVGLSNFDERQGSEDQEFLCGISSPLTS